MHTIKAPHQKYWLYWSKKQEGELNNRTSSALRTVAPPPSEQAKACATTVVLLKNYDSVL